LSVALGTVQDMNVHPLAAADGVPPRQVEAWTQVSGHVVIADRPRAFCSCGERSPHDWGGTAREWRQQHLRDAWPILVPRDGDEPYGDWLNRIALEHSKAVQVEDRIYSHLGLDRPVEPGQPFPVITAEYAAASERVEVLEHQMNAVRAKLSERNGWAD
jgi:hypothetical protein